MKQQDGKPRLFSFTLRDFLIFAAIFICALVLCTLLRRSDISDGFASPVFVLAVLLTSRFTNGYLFGTLAAFLSVIGINYIFTFPYWEFNFTMTGYPLTFFVMLCVSLVTCTMTTKIKQQEQFRMESEREKMRANLLRSVSHDIRTAAGNNNMSPEYLTRAIRQYLPQYEIPFSAYHRMNVFTSDGTPFR